MNAKNVFTTLVSAVLLCLCIFAQGQSDGKGQGAPPATADKSTEAETPAQGPYLHPWDFVQVDLDKDSDGIAEVYVSAQALRSNPSVQGIVATAKYLFEAPRVLTDKLKQPRGMATDGVYLYVADGGADGVYRVDKDGNTALVAGGIKDPRYLTMDDKGNLYVSATKTAGKDSSKGGGNQGQGIVYKIIRGETLPWAVKPFADGFHDPRGVSWWENVLYVADSLGDNGKVYKLVDGTKALVAEGFHRVEGIDVDACGNIYVAHGEGNHGKVEVIFPDGYRTIWKEEYGALRGVKVYESDIWPDTNQVGTTDWKNSTVESLMLASLQWTNAKGDLRMLGGDATGMLFVEHMPVEIREGNIGMRYRVCQSRTPIGPWEFCGETQIGYWAQPGSAACGGEEVECWIERYKLTLGDNLYQDSDTCFRLEIVNSTNEVVHTYDILWVMRPTCNKAKPLPFMEGAGTKAVSAPVAMKSLLKKEDPNQNVILTETNSSDLNVEWPCGQDKPCIPEYDREWLKNEDITTIRLTREEVGRKLAGSFLSLETPLRDVDGLLIQNITIHGQTINNYADLLYVEAIYHGVNPQVLLTLLQKESGSVSNPSRPPLCPYQVNLFGWCPTKCEGLQLPTQPLPVYNPTICDRNIQEIDWNHTIRGQTHWAARQLELNQGNAGLRCRNVRTTDGGACVKPGTIATGSMFYYNPEVGEYFYWGPDTIRNIGGNSAFYYIWTRWGYGTRLQDWVYVGDRKPDPNSTTSETKPEISAVARSCYLVSRAGAGECPRPVSDYAAINANSITESNITLTSEDGATVNITDLAVTPVDETGEKRFKISFKPAEDLESGKTYKAEINNVKDELGNNGSTDWVFEVASGGVVQPIMTRVVGLAEYSTDKPAQNTKSRYIHQGQQAVEGIFYAYEGANLSDVEEVWIDVYSGVSLEINGVNVGTRWRRAGDDDTPVETWRVVVNRPIGGDSPSRPDHVFVYGLRFNTHLPHKIYLRMKGETGSEPTISESLIMLAGGSRGCGPRGAAVEYFIAYGSMADEYDLLPLNIDYHSGFPFGFGAAHCYYSPPRSTCYNYWWKRYAGKYSYLCMSDNGYTVRYIDGWYYPYPYPTPHGFLPIEPQPSIGCPLCYVMRLYINSYRFIDRRDKGCWFNATGTWEKELVIDYYYSAKKDLPLWNTAKLIREYAGTEKHFFKEKFNIETPFAYMVTVEIPDPAIVPLSVEYSGVENLIPESLKREYFQDEIDFYNNLGVDEPLEYEIEIVKE